MAQKAHSSSGASPQGNFIIGIDVGGTFADVICVGSNGMWTRKTPSRPDEPGADVVEGIRQIALLIGLADGAELLRRTALIFHGSTVATNTLLTLSGATVGLITTRGFRDIVEMRGGRRESTFDSHLLNAKPLAPRELRFEIEEQVTCDGEVRVPAKRNEVEDAARRLIADGAEAIAIAYKHSAVNASNEDQSRDWVMKLVPERFVSASAELSRRPRLYDRTSSAVVNAYVGPATAGYIQGLAARLRDLGFAGELLIMGGSGGVLALGEARRVPIKLLLSGPAAGPVGAGLSLPKGSTAIVVDMGGTSFDVCVVQGGAVATSSTRDVNRYRVGVPMLDIHTIGAGGGSIAHMDAAGLLQVGPASAGAIPGPAAYGLGGTDPTVTDANLVLGLLDPEMILGESRPLSILHSRKAVATLARRLHLSAEDCAAGIRAVANGSMVAAVREMTVGRGLDPRALVLVAGGGAGPLHAADIADELGIRSVIIPGHAGVLCAVGMAASDLIYETSISVVRTLDLVDRSALESSIRAVREELEQRLRGATRLQWTTSNLECEARYEGQFHELLVSASESELVGLDMANFTARFHETHEAAYGFRSDDAKIELVNVLVRVSGAPVLEPRALIQGRRGGLSLASTGTRKVFTGRSQPPRDVPVLKPNSDRDSVNPAPLIQVAKGNGPTLVDLPTSTVFVPPGWSFAASAQGDIRLTRHRAAGATT